MPLLSVTNLHKTYRLGKVDVPVLRGVDLSVEQGQIVAILGASGSGKSTLLHLVGGLDRPDPPRSNGTSNGSARETGPSGITFDGRNLARFSNAELDRYRNQDVGFVFQFYHLLPELTVLDNVLLGLMIRHGRLGYMARARECRSKASALLERVGLGHRLGHRPSELSGGERQRVAIARALVTKPRLLLADEPTGNLDQQTGASVLEALLELRAADGATMVIVTHDPNTARRADHVVKLADGKVVVA
jgi:lipoprotein-releasing system ATP-binding protein